MRSTPPVVASRGPRLEWLPPVMVGASGAVAAEVAMGMLLYGGVGFVRSLTTILAVQGFALGAGLWSAPDETPDLVDRMRHRWLLCLVSFLVAALFGTAWTLVPVLGDSAPGQGVGLGLLAGLPLYAVGALLGGMAVVADSDPGERLSRPGSAAAVGAALGFVLTGLLLPRTPMPGTLLVACLVLLSLGGMVYGSVLGFRTEIDVRARRPSWGGEVRVQERRLPVEEVAVLELLEGDRLRRSQALDSAPTHPWDVEVWRSRLPTFEEPFRVLMLGAGASPAPRAILREHPRATVDVLERCAAVVELGREFFGTDLRVGVEDRISVEVGNLDDGVARARGHYDLVMVDTDALGPMGGVMGLSAASLDRLRELAAPGGEVVFGPEKPEAGLLERSVGS